MIKRIKLAELREMKGKEGLILQGCGGDLHEWVDGINDLLTSANILLEGTRFDADDCRSFEQGGLTCLYYPFDKVKLDVGKLAMWRLRTHEQFGGTWLSDYVPNRLGGFVQTKLERFEAEVEAIKSDVHLTEIHTSPDFQCDQTEGFPVSLCACFSKEKAWLELNRTMAMDSSDEELQHYKNCCAEFGVRECPDEEAFNQILKELGEEAVENASLYPEEDEGMTM